MLFKNRDKTVSLESHILTLIGSALYGSPSSNGLPKDFFYKLEDRRIPAPHEAGFSEAQKNIYVNLTRAALARLEKKVGMVLGVVMLALLLMVGKSAARALGVMF